MRLQLIALVTACAVATPAAAEEDEDRWQISTDTLVYGDDDNVFVVTPQVGVRRTLDDDDGAIAARTAIDIISAASVDVVSEASTRFDEVRTETELSAQKRIGAYLPLVGYRVSIEPDYRSHTLRVSGQRELGSPDTVGALGYGISLDTVGRAGTSFATFSESLVSHSADASLTQVLGPKTLVRAIYSLVVQDGYMEKPYRHVPMFTEVALMEAAAAGGSLGLDDFARYSAAVRPPEAVPDRRIRNAAAVRALRFVPAIDGALRLDYRFYFDDWGVTSHTVEPGVRVPLRENLQLDARLRFYQQSGASFWRREYVLGPGNALPRWRTLDRELSPYWSLYGGARLDWRHGPLQLYGEGIAMYTRFGDFLLLDDRLALIGQAGLRWSL